MRNLRKLFPEEKALVATLLRGKPGMSSLLGELDDINAEEMSDGGMGSLLLVPMGHEGTSRHFGKQLALGQFLDSDGVPVSVAINVDDQGHLYELDVWKVDFSPLLGWPDPAAVTTLK